MQQTIIRLLAVTGILLCLAALGSAQVTLSKGWGPGKRAFHDENCRLATKFVFTMCRKLMSDLRQLMACETRGMMAYGQPAEPPSINEVMLAGRNFVSLRTDVGAYSGEDRGYAFFSVPHSVRARTVLDQPLDNSLSRYRSS